MTDPLDEWRNPTPKAAAWLLACLVLGAVFVAWGLLCLRDLLGRA